jgi:hypothetical protein
MDNNFSEEPATFYSEDGSRRLLGNINTHLELTQFSI